MSLPAATKSQIPVGFIGLGNMGNPMATKIVEGGYPVVAYDVNQTFSKQLAEKPGIAAAKSLSDLAGCSVIILMLPDGKVVRSVVLGEGTSGGLQAICKAGTVIIDMSSSAPIGTRELGETLKKKNIALVDAPVSGGVKRAVSGTLAIMVGGEKADIAKVEPVLKTMGTSVIETGGLGSGHAMKALNNYVSAAGLLAACEALDAGQKFGIEPETIVRALNSSTGKNNSTEVKLNQFIVSRAFNSGFSLGLMRKDLATAVDLAKAVHGGMPLADALLGSWTAAEQRYGKGADHTEIHRLVLDSAEGEKRKVG